MTIFFFDFIVYNLYLKRLTPITMKSILLSGPLKTKLMITINYNNHDQKPIKQSVPSGDMNIGE